MKKAELITTLQERLSADYDLQLTKKDVRQILDGFVDTLKSELNRTGRFSLYSVGTFMTKELGERQARNPKTGEAVVAAPTTKVRFKASSKILS